MAVSPVMRLKLSVRRAIDRLGNALAVGIVAVVGGDGTLRRLGQPVVLVVGILLAVRTWPLIDGHVRQPGYLFLLVGFLILQVGRYFPPPQAFELHAFLTCQRWKNQNVRPTVNSGFQLKSPTSCRPNRFGTANHQKWLPHFRATHLIYREHTYNLKPLPWI